MIKNICKNIIIDAARYVSTVIVAAMYIFPSCNDYLDIVPDKGLSLETLFATKEEAYNVLAKCYYYLPDDSKSASTWLLGDEWIGDLNSQSNNGAWLPTRIMERKQSASSTNGSAPIMGIWSGTGSGKKVYEGINACNLFISMIDRVQDMDAVEKADWKAQITFLKAYYHFLLLQRYGPIVIMDNVVSPNDDPSSLYVSRSKIDDCFDYIVKTIDKAIPDLEVIRDNSDLGQVNRLGAMAIKARVLLFRASPFYSGNDDYGDDYFLDHDEKPFFPQDDAATTKAKWKDAVDAIEAAITLCESSGVELYKYEKTMLGEDFEANKLNHDNIQTLYDLRMVICDRQNKERIWGNTNVLATDYNLSTDGNIMLPAGYSGITMTPNNCRNVLGATYKTLERYYTKHGLPLDDDKTFDRGTMHDLTHTPDTAVTKEYLGILQSDVETIHLYLDREPRFYANVGITGGYWRSHSVRITTTFYTNSAGGRFAARGNNFFWSAIGAQKVVHIDNKYDSRMVTMYPIPIIRLADLYLMKAEALNEYLDAPNADVYAAINKVRKRAGIPDVEVAYTGAFVRSEATGKHTHKTGMREIIAEERKVEFAFEGHIFWDMIRNKKAPEEFTSPALGWTYSAEKEDFFSLKLLQLRSFTLRDCLWPIDINELDKNSRLIQNPGW
jgi:hypothetical protein